MTSFPIQATFSRGELTPRLHSRIDIDHFRMGLAECTNWMTMVYGGLRKRPGFKFIEPVRDSSKKARLIPFIFSTVQAYALEFGDQYFIPFANQAVVTEAGKTITGITQANPAVVTSASHGFANGDEVVLSGVVGMTEVNGKRFMVANQTTNTFQLSGTGSTGFTAYASGGEAARIVRVATPYLEAELFDLHIAQSADVLYLAHKSHAPRKVERTSNTAWTISEIEFIDGPYLEDNETTTTLSPSAASGTGITITASAATGINDDQGFLSTDVGRLVSIKHGSAWGYARITAVGSTTSVTADVKGNFGGTGAVTDWKLGAWSGTTGYPARVGFFQERLCWARTDTQPQTVWASKAGDLEDHATSDPLVADDAMTVTILAGQVNEIQWLAEGDDLKIGTTGASRTLGPQTTADAFGPTNVKQRRETSYGANAVQPVDVGQVTLYPGFYGKTIREFLYSFEADGYVSPKLSTLNEHLLKSGIAGMAFAQEPDSIVWAVVGDGRLIGITYERDQQVVGMFPVVAGGTDAVFESVVTIPGSECDEVWVIVRRTINGTTRRYIEVLDCSVDEDSAIAASFYVDSGLTYTGPATGTVTGLDHLEGEAVAVLADGAVQPAQTVSNGAVTLPGGKIASTIHVGLAYAARAATLPLQVTGRDGVLIGRNQRVQKAIVDILNSGGVKVGTDAGQLELFRRKGSDRMDQPIGLRSGFHTVRFNNSWRDLARLTMVSSDPLPAYIRSVILGVEAEP